MILVDSNDRKKKIDYDIEEILAEFADREAGLTSLADKYRVKVGDVPAPRTQKKFAREPQQPEPPKEEPLPGGHRVVYEDKSLCTGQNDDAKDNPKTAQGGDCDAPVLPAGVRVVYDADAGITDNSNYDFSAFEDITLPSEEQQRNGEKSRAQKPLKKKATPARPRVSEPTRNTAAQIPKEKAPFDDFQSFDAIEPNANKSTRGKSHGGKNPKDSPAARFFFSFFPRKGDGAGEIFRKLVFTVSACVLVGSLVFIVNNLLEKELEVEPPSEITTSAEGDYIDPRDDYPDIDFPEGLQDKFVPLYARNQDFAGWFELGVNGESFVSWVVQEKSKTDSSVTDFYLKHDFDKNDSNYGTPFLDFRNDTDAKDTNTIIYAHNMTDGAQFGLLEYFIDDIESLKQPYTLTYQPWNAPQPYVYKIYAVFISNAQKEQDNGYVFAYHTPRFMNEDAFLGYKRMIDLKNMYTTGIDINFSDKLLTLSTCGYNTTDFTESRYVIVARMLREGENPETDPTQVQENPSPWYPQAWYDRRKLTNPFKDTERWYEY